MHSTEHRCFPKPVRLGYMDQYTLLYMICSGISNTIRLRMPRFAIFNGIEDNLTADEHLIIDLVVNTFGEYSGKVLERINSFRISLESCQSWL